MRPKQKFQNDQPTFQAWVDIIQTKAFQEAIDAAMLEMVELQPLSGNHTDRYDNQAQLVGARVFTSILSNLHKKDISIATTPLPNLKTKICPHK